MEKKIGFFIMVFFLLFGIPAVQEKETRPMIRATEYQMVGGLPDDIMEVSVPATAPAVSATSTSKPLSKVKKSSFKIVKPRKKVKKLSKRKRKKKKHKKYLGVFRLTYYCKCKKCTGKWHGSPTASGTKCVEGRTIAVDTEVIPMGSKVMIDRHSYRAEDTGGGIKGKRLDVYLKSHQRCIKKGVDYKKVYVMSKGEMNDR